MGPRNGPPGAGNGHLGRPSGYALVDDLPVLVHRTPQVLANRDQNQREVAGTPRTPPGPPREALNGALQVVSSMLTGGSSQS